MRKINGREVTEADVKAVVDRMLETGEVVIVGYTADGKAQYALKEYAEANNLKPQSN